MKKLIQDYLFLFGIAGFLVLLDQWSKEMVRQNLAFQETWVPWPWLLPYARIVHWKNTGAAFGMLQNFGDIFMILAMIVALFILYYFPRVPRQDRLIRLAMAIQFGGAIGNLIDRLSQGYVTDFIMLGSLPVFNVADACISIGVGLLILGVWLKDRQEGRLARSSTPESAREEVSEVISEDT